MTMQVELYQMKDYAEDGYMVVSGLLNRQISAGKNASTMASAALRLQKEVQSFYHPDMENQRLHVQSGMASGAVVVGIVGRHIPHYYLFGTVMVSAKEMETTGQVMKIQIADATHHLLDTMKFDMAERFDKAIKAGETRATYWLVSER